MSGTSIPGIYVAVRGDFNQLSKDIKQAKQLVTEQARGMSDALNNALSPAQAKNGINTLITNLSTLNQASKVTSASFKGIGVDLGELRRHTNLTAAEFQKLQTQILRTSTINAQERAFGNIVKSANLSTKEIQTLGRQFNLSTEQISKFTDTTRKAGNQTESLGFKMKTMIATVALYSVAFQAISSVMSKIGNEFKLGFSSIEDFNVSVAASAAYITTFSEKAAKGDLAGAYKDAVGYSKPLIESLEMIDAKTIATGKNLTDMYETFLKNRVLLDINNKEQVEGFTNIATALALVTKGQNADLQIRQEINALLTGQVRMTDMLPQLLIKIDPKLKEHMELWRQEGTVIENVGNLLKGFSASTGGLDDLWLTVGATMETINKRVLRGGFEPAFKDLIKLAKDLNRSLQDTEGKLTPLAENIQKNIIDVYQTGKEVVSEYGETIFKLTGLLVAVKTAQLLFNVAVKANPYVAAATAALFLAEKLGVLQFALGKVGEAAKSVHKSIQTLQIALEAKDKGIWDWVTAGGDTLQKWQQEIDNGVAHLKEKIYELNQQRKDVAQGWAFTPEARKEKEAQLKAIDEQIKKYQDLIVLQRASTPRDKDKQGVVEDDAGISVPKLVPGGPNDDVNNSLARDANAARDAQVAYLKALEERKLATIKSSNALQEQANQQAYDLGIKSYKKYLEEKSRLTVAELNAELSTKQKQLADARTAADNITPITDKEGKARPDKDLKARFDALKKVELAEKAVIETQNKLNIAQSVGSQDLILANREMADSYKEIQIQLLETQGQTVQAARMQAQLDEQSVERLRMITAAREGDKGAQEALQNLRKQSSLVVSAAEMDVISRSKEAQLSVADLNGEYQRSIELQLELIAVEIERARMSGATPEEIAYLQRQSAEIEKLKTPLGSLSKGLKDFSIEYGNTAENMLEMAAQTAQGMQGAFKDFFFDGMKGELKSLGDYVLSFLNTVQQALAQVMSNQITSSLVGLISSFGGSIASPALATGSSSIGSVGNTTYGAYSATLNAKGNAYSGESGLSSYRNRIVSTPTTFKFANGLMGEAGSSVGEAIVPLKRMPSGNVGVESSGTAVNNINIYGDGQATQTSKPNNSGGMDIDVIFDTYTAKNLNRPGSATNKALMSNTGASIPLIRR